MSEDRDFPVLGRPYIVKLKGVWQEQIYIADQADGEMCPGERFWSREDLDECPSFDYEHDDWISIREAVSNRDQLAALKEENERLKEILDRQCTLAATLADERDALNARVAELEAREVDAIANKICGRIPPGYYIKLHLEKEAGWAELDCPGIGDDRDDFEGGIYSQLVCALEVAEELSKEPANEG